MRIVVLLLLGFMTSLPVVTIAQQTTRRICDTIHYEYVHDKIIIPVIVYRGYRRADRNDKRECSGNEGYEWGNFTRGIRSERNVVSL